MKKNQIIFWIIRLIFIVLFVTFFDELIENNLLNKASYITFTLIIIDIDCIAFIAKKILEKTITGLRNNTTH